MPNDRFYITLSNENEVYAPGSDVEGIAHIILGEDTKAEFLKISLCGRARTEWRERIGVGKTMRTKSYSAKVIYADEEVVAWSSPPGTTEVLEAGSHQYPFTLKLPTDLPPSFEGKYGYVRYMLKMELDRPWYRANKKNNKAFTVVPTIDLNTVSQAILPAKALKVKKLGNVLFRHGEVEVECETSKSGFVPGEVIVVSAHVINDSSKDIVKARVELMEISTYVGNSCSQTFEPKPTFIDEGLENKRHQQQRRLAAAEQFFNIARHSEGDVELYLQVPSTVPSFDNCPIIKVEYTVEVKFESSGSINSNIYANVPIVIGTIPARGRPIRDENAPQSSSGSSPKQETEKESAPSCSCNAGGNSLSAMLTPSYKESVNGVNGTTMDKDKINEPFVPRYPFYPQLSEVYKKGGSGD